MKDVAAMKEKLKKPFMSGMLQYYSGFASGIPEGGTKRKISFRTA